ncbi:MAG: hypothetical protein GC164_02295 [Phycisphaera sp.]|nr:hypothetical protein [Phycisphaera sp.]
MTRTLRIGVIGAGGNTRRKHIPKLLEQEDVAIVGVCNRTVASARVVCDEFDIPHAVERPQQLIDDPAIDVIVIGTWPYIHCEYTLAALAAGKHVMCEARMAMNATEAQRMVDAARQRPDLIAQIVPAPFTLAVDAKMRKIVDEQIGRLLAVRMELIAKPDTDEPPKRTWRRDRSLSGNNIMGIGIYYESLMRWVGPVAAVHAELRISRSLGVDPVTGAQAVIDVPDHVEAVGSMPCGAAFSMTASSIAVGSAPGTRIHIAGSEGVLSAIDSDVSFTPKGGTPIPITPDPALGWRVEEEFINAIRGREPIRLTDFDTGLLYMRFTDALHESHRLGQLVRAN